MRGFDHATILSPSFHGLRKERKAQWLPFFILNTMKSVLQIMSLAAYASETKNQAPSKTLDFGNFKNQGPVNWLLF